MLECLRLYWAFFKIGLFTIGGGYAMIPLINSEVVSIWPQMANSMQDLIGISQITPGAFAINAATFTGMMVYGVGGAVAATLGVLTPSCIITTVIARFFYQVRNKKFIRHMFYGMRPVVVGLITGTVLVMLPPQWMISIQGFDVNFKAVFITLISGYGMMKMKLNPIIMILVSGLLGFVLFGLL